MERAAIEIVRTLRKAGRDALFAGGCVRDRLRRVAPKDYDIVTDAPPEEILALFPRSGTIGAHFGVVLVRRGRHSFEVATYREDGEYRDGRHPESVRFSGREQDARRRDFTVNAMFFDPLEEEVIDLVGGRGDLERRLIRAVGDPRARFGEDHLRMLRAVRLAAELDFSIEKGTWEALREAAPRIASISPERVRAEMDRIWACPRRLQGFDLLAGSGLMEAVVPEIMALRGCEQPPEWHPEGDVYTHTRRMLELLPPEADTALVLSVLLHDIGKPATFSRDAETGRIRFHGHDKVGARIAEEILRRLRYSNATIAAVTSAVAGHMAFKDVRKMRQSTLKRFMAKERFNEELELHRVDCEASNGRLENYHFLLEKREEFAHAPLVPPRLLTGKDLLARGWRPGPEISRILARAQDLQLEGEITSREEALEWLDRRAVPDEHPAPRDENSS